MKLTDMAAPSGGIAWDKPAVGDYIQGTITYLGFLTGLNFAKDKTQRKSRIDLDVFNQTTGQMETHTIYAVINTDWDPETNTGNGFAKRLARAIATGAHNAGVTELAIGGQLTVQRVNDVPTESGPAHDYVATYVPPATVAPLPVAEMAAPVAPVAQPAPVAPVAPAPVAPVAPAPVAPVAPVAQPAPVAPVAQPAPVAPVVQPAPVDPAADLLGEQ